MSIKCSLINIQYYQEWMARKTVYMPPEAKIIVLKDFDLSKIEETFQYASFERRISKQKVHKIAHAILENKFTDNVLRLAASDGAVKYDVIDGQHRIEGLRYARDYWSLGTYDLILFVYLAGNKREIYRRLNLGKPLTLSDHLKALDHGNNKFFNDLREYCDHYSKGSKLRYSTVINCLHYAKSTSIRAVRPLAIDDFIQSITTRDITIIKKFIPILYQVATNPDSIFYHYTIMRNFFRVYYENNIVEDGMIALGKILAKSQKIQDLAEKRDNHAMRGIYHFIIDRAGPKVGLYLEKGIVKDKE
jgi:hypothetical protein